MANSTIEEAQPWLSSAAQTNLTTVTELVAIVGGVSVIGTLFYSFSTRVVEMTSICRVGRGTASRADIENAIQLIANGGPEVKVLVGKTIEGLEKNGKRKEAGNLTEVWNQAKEA